MLGMFRTGILSPDKTHHALASTAIQDYATVQAELRSRYQASDGKQVGDPVLAAEKIMDAVAWMNASSAPFPHRIPLGSDALTVIKRKCTDTLEGLKGWETFASSTDFIDDPSLGPSFGRL